MQWIGDSVFYFIIYKLRNAIYDKGYSTIDLKLDVLQNLALLGFTKTFHQRIFQYHTYISLNDLDFLFRIHKRNRNQSQ